MNYNKLHYFYEIAKAKNISHTAERLFISQSSLSKAVADLEKDFDTKLFIRTNKKVILTEEGMLFRETAEDILKLYNRAKADHTDQNEIEGEIYIAAGEIESFDIVAEKIRDFHLLHPKVLFHIYSGNAEEICAAIDKGTADIGFIIQSVNTMKYEVCSLNTSEAWGILVRKDHRLASKEYVTARDLQKEKLIVPDNSRLRNDIREWIGPRTHVAATYTLLRNAMILTRVSDWVTVCLETRKQTGDGLVFVPFSPQRVSSASLIWKKRPVYSPALFEFLNYFGIHNLNDK